ncbi:MAG: ABC transporter ATP-binding protein [Mogibacterium sp.]|nr:ABC transporter ATP-binding protein [Mogibacterium sp.]
MSNINNNEVVVKFENVTKIYKLYKSSRARFKGLFSSKVPYKINKAIDNMSFEVRRGESVALFGRNGAGKSTMLKMITGVTFPTEGEITVNGKVSALLELGAGFDVESTGRENIRFKCSLMGMTEEEIDAVEEDIVQFADIGDYMDQPLRSYSSGMKARLGFAISANAQPDILIVDEALSVGDKNFQKKCKNKVAEIMADESVTLLFVTHSLASAKDFCSRGIVLEKGKMLFDGDIDSAIQFYESKN